MASLAAGLSVRRDAFGFYHSYALDWATGTKMVAKLKSLNFLIGFLLFLFYAPLVVTCVKAFVSHGQGLSLYWFQELFQDPTFFSALQNSLILAVISAVLSVTLSLLAVINLPGLKIYPKMMSASMSMPEIILALSLLSLFSIAGISMGFTTALVAHITLTLSFSFWILAQQFQNLDPSLREAALDLGASEKQIFWQITLPQLKPAMISSFWICFLLSLDDFLVSFFVTGSSYETLPLKLFSMLKVGLNPKVNALSFLILMVSGFILVAIYPVFKKMGKPRKVQ